jgi:catechol 2,3-dioxygenase-like lactoylglutathione lyase family enzyme
MSLLGKMMLVSYNVVNWEQAKKFYGETLGMPMTFGDDKFGWFQYGPQDGAQIAINLWRGPEPVPPREGGGIAVFEAPDVRKTVTELRARGVRCDDPIVVPGMVTYATFYDPEGNQLQLAGPAS